MIDITCCEQIASDFEGSEKKFAIFYNSAAYMIKEPDPIREKNNQLSYMNNTFSEHIGCKIFQLLDIPVQETFLAKYKRSDGKTEIVVACKDFRSPGEQLYEADKFAKSLINSNNISKPDYTEIQKIFQKVSLNLSEDAEQRFWDTFVVDALIGNKDRHLGNWGFLSKDRVHLTLAPIYDCGSSLGALVDEEKIKLCLEKDGIMSNMECNIGTRFTINGKYCTYREVLFNPPQKLIKSINNIVPKINLKAIDMLINSIPALDSKRKKFMIRSISMRYEQILKRALKKVTNCQVLLSSVPLNNNVSSVEEKFIECYNKAIFKGNAQNISAIEATKYLFMVGYDVDKIYPVLEKVLPQAQNDDLYSLNIIHKAKESLSTKKALPEQGKLHSDSRKL